MSVTKEKKPSSKSKVIHDTGSSSGSSVDQSPVYSTEDQIGYRVAAGSITIDREEYLQAHRDLTYEKNIQQTRNNILHRRMAEYYKKRKLDHVLKPLENAQDLEEKYQSKLIAYEELKEKDEREMADIAAKLQAVQMQYEERLEKTEGIFRELQQLERSIGIGLIYSKKGKPIGDKTVENYLRFQRNKRTQCCAMRLRYIRARNAVAELDAIVKKLETLGPGLYVAHYEQLVIENQNYSNKIEERENELIKNRTKCTEQNMILAHIREKMHHTEEVIDFTECDMGDAEIDYLRAREGLNTAKSRRDKLRWALGTERIKAGLLTRHDLLRDYQNAGDEVEVLRAEKERLEACLADTAKQLKEIRQRVKLQKSAVSLGRAAAAQDEQET